MDERYYLYNSIEEKRSSFSKEIINSSYYYDNNGNAAAVVESHESQLVERGRAVDVACTQSPIAGIQLGWRDTTQLSKRRRKKKGKSHIFRLVAGLVELLVGGLCRFFFSFSSFHSGGARGLLIHCCCLRFIRNDFFAGWRGGVATYGWLYRPLKMTFTIYLLVYTVCLISFVDDVESNGSSSGGGGGGGALFGWENHTEWDIQQRLILWQ